MKRKEVLKHTTIWINLEEIMLSEIRRKKANFINIRYLFFSFWLTSLCMTDSRSICLFVGRNRDVAIENGHVDTVGEGEGGTNWEIKVDINTLPCVK